MNHRIFLFSYPFLVLDSETLIEFKYRCNPDTNYLNVKIYESISDDEDFKIEYLLTSNKKNQIVFTMDGSNNHACPHLHISFGNHKHAISITIKMRDNVILAQNPKLKIRKWQIDAINEWIYYNYCSLIKIWKCLHPWGQENYANKYKNRLSDFDNLLFINKEINTND